MIREKITIIKTNREEETVSLGRMVGSKLKGGDVVGLIGELGAGKTYLVKGLAEGLGIPEDQYVASPTFTLINEYKGNIMLYHFDLYRIQHEKELEGIGYDEYLYGNGVVVIEWAEKMSRLLPTELLLIEIQREGESKRKFIFTGKGSRYAQLVEEIEEDQKYHVNFSKFLAEEV